MSNLPEHPGYPLPAPVPGPPARAVGALFRGLSALRGSRIFHPKGTAYEATLEMTNGWEGVPAFTAGARHRAIVRLSRAAGLPESVPDALGIGLRLPDVHGPARHQDFLLVTSASGPVLQHLLLPGVRRGQPYSSILLYRIGSDLRLVGALPDGEKRFRLAVAPLTGGWSPIGELRLGRTVPAEYA